MKKLLILALSFLFVFTFIVTADEYPVYKAPSGSASEEKFYIEPELVRGLDLGLDGNGLGGISIKKKYVRGHLRIVPLAPKHTGLTTVSQPILLWYINQGWPEKITFSLDEQNSKQIKPIKFEFTGPSRAGIYQINLSHRKITLEPGKKYEWFLTVEYRGYTASVSAKIEYKKPSQAFISELERTQIQKMMFRYASASYWYDAVYEAQKRVSNNPSDKISIAQRDSLLSQIGIKLK